MDSRISASMSERVRIGGLRSALRDALALSADYVAGLKEMHRTKVRIALTYHARDRMRQYGISKRDIKRVLRKPDTVTEEGKNQCPVYRRTMRGYDYGVATRGATEDPDKHLVTTVFKDEVGKPYAIYGSTIRDGYKTAGQGI